MKPTRRIKRINGIEYWYEETPYYDPVSKQTRHTSRYLGRNVDGEPVRMRSAPDEVIAMIRKPEVAVVRSSFDYGSIFPSSAEPAGSAPRSASMNSYQRPKLPWSPH